jgi:hypothetical protein
VGCAKAAAPSTLARWAAHAARADEADQDGARALVSTPARTADRPADAVAGLLATLAIFGSCIALAYRPVRITPFTILIALVAAGMGGRHQRLAAAALMISGVCFIAGTFFAIITNHPIF